MTVLPFGAARCIDCKAPVAIVRRTVEIRCSPLDADMEPPYAVCIVHDWRGTMARCSCHTHAVPDVGPVTLVDEAGIRHECAAVAE